MSKHGKEVRAYGAKLTASTSSSPTDAGRTQALRSQIAATFARTRLSDATQLQAKINSLPAAQLRDFIVQTWGAGCLPQVDPWVRELEALEKRQDNKP